MYSVMPKKGFPIIKLLLIAGAVYAAYTHWSGISNYLSKNQTLQEVKSSLKWAYDELRPATEAERAQRAAFYERERQKTAEYHKMGIKPHIEFVDKSDAKKYEEAKKDWPELRKQLYQGIDD